MGRQHWSEFAVDAAATLPRRLPATLAILVAVWGMGCDDTDPIERTTPVGPPVTSPPPPATVPTLVSDFEGDGNGSAEDWDNAGWSGEVEVEDEAAEADGIEPESPEPVDGYYLQGDDVNVAVTGYFCAPDAWTGDLSGYYGGRLSYQLWTWSEVVTPRYDYERDSDIIIVGDDDEELRADIVFDANETVERWTVRGLDLVATNFYRYAEDLEKVPVDEAEAKMVFSQVSEIRIRGEYFGGFDSGALDNVVLAPPE